MADVNIPIWKKMGYKNVGSYNRAVNTATGKAPDLTQPKRFKTPTDWTNPKDFGDVVIPSDTSIPNSTGTTPEPTSTEINKPIDTTLSVPDITDSTSAANAVVEADKAAAAKQLEIDKENERLAKERLAEEKRIADEKKQLEIDNAAAQKKILEDAAAAQKIENDKAIAETERAKAESIRITTEKEQSSKAMLEAAQDEQKFKDEEALRKATKDVYVAQIQANVAFQKLGLTFSAGAIKTTQTIATEGATAIAGLKLTAANNEAQFAGKVAQVELDYATEINNTIETYTNKSINLRKEQIARIEQTSSNLLLTETEKKRNINQIIDQYRTNKKQAEIDMIAAMKTTINNQVISAKAIQQDIKARESEGLEKAKITIATGGFAKMTSEQRRAKEKELGVPAFSLDAEMHSQINALITDVTDSVLGRGELLSVPREQVVKQVIDEMKAGRNLESATQVVMERILKNDARYIRKQNEANLKTTLSTTEAEAKLSTYGVNDFSNLYTGNNGPAFANNNPGNIKDTSFGGSAGGKGGFTKFNTIEDGMNALIEKLKYNQANGVGGVNNGSSYNGNMSLLEYFKKYAPSSDGNNPNSYANTVASALGVNSSTKLKDVDAEKLAIQIAKHENGGVYNEMVKRGIISDGAYTPKSDGKYTDGVVSEQDLMINIPGYPSMNEAEKKTIRGMTAEQRNEYIAKNTKGKTVKEDKQAEKKELISFIGQTFPQYYSSNEKTKKKLEELPDDAFDKLSKDMLLVDNLVNEVSSGDTSGAQNKLYDIINKLRVGFEDEDIKKILQKYTDSKKNFYVKGDNLYFYDRTVGGWDDKIKIDDFLKGLKA